MATKITWQQAIDLWWDHCQKDEEGKLKLQMIVGEIVNEAQQVALNSIGDNMSDIAEKKIVVDEKEVTKEELEEMKKDKTIRLHEEAPDKFRVLHKLVE